MAIDDPNVVLPLAVSYNERGVAGYTHTVTNGEDQRKVNCFYEVAKNPLTGKGTLTLSKRPGVATNTFAGSYGSASAQQVYLIIQAPVVSNTSQGDYPNWVIHTNGGFAAASSNSVTTNIQALGSEVPAYIDKTNISGTDTVVLQMVPFATSSPHRAWYSSSIATWKEISAASAGAFTSVVHRGKMEHMDGFAFIQESTNKIINSDSNSLVSWSAGSFITKQIVQDVPVGLAKLKNQLIAFGQETVEMFYNAGNTVGSPLGRVPYLHQRIGLIAPIQTADQKGHYYAVSGDKLYFVGRRSVGKFSPGVFSYDGQSFSKVSTPYIDKIIAERVYSNTTGFSSVNSVGFNGQQAIAFLLTNLNVAAPYWLMYFPDWNEWFEWTSSVFLPVNNGENYLPAGTTNKNVLYSFDNANFAPADNWQDAGTSYQWLTQFRLPTNGSSQKRMLMYGVDADTDTSASSISVDVSDDDCQSFKSLQSIDLTKERKINFRGGAYTRRHVRLSATDARPKRIANFIAHVSD